MSLAAAYSGRGLTYYHQSKYDLAISDFDYAIALAQAEGGLEAHNTEGLITANRGFAKYYLEKYPEAIADLSAAIALGVNSSAQVYEVRSTAYQLLGFDAEALEDRQVSGANMIMTKLVDGTLTRLFHFERGIPIPNSKGHHCISNFRQNGSN